MSLFGGNSFAGSNTNKSLFGNQPAQPTQSGSLFGAFTTNKPASPFGANTNPQKPLLFGAAPAATGGLFGSTNTNAGSQPTTGGGIFGAPQPAANNQTQTGSSLFASSQPAQSGSLFGSTLAPSQNQNQGGGMFGSSNNNNNAQKPTLSLFGGSMSNNQNQQNQQQKPSLFGTSTQQQPQQPQQQSSLFGQSSRLPGLTLGQSGQQAQQQQPIPGVKIDTSNIRGTTRFADLHETLQKEVEEIDNFIQQQISFKEQCETLMPGHGQNIVTIPGDVEYVKERVNTAELALDNDVAAIKAMKELVLKDAEDARLSFRAVDTLHLPQQYQHPQTWHGSAVSQTRDRIGDDDSDHPSNLVTFFEARTTEMSKILNAYTQQIAEIESHLRTLELNAITQSHQLQFTRGRDGTGRSGEEQVRELGAVLREFEGGIINVATKIGAVREATNGLSK